MVFTSIGFLTLFLPVFFAVYFACPSKGRNVVLLFGSLLFYWIGGPGHFLVLLLFIVWNYHAGKIIAKLSGRARLGTAFASIAVNIGVLVYFKYIHFFAETINRLLSLFAGFRIPVPDAILPVGISFFTFQGIAYLVDVYRGKHAPARSFIEFAVFKAAFPQLIAGPIVRYPDVSRELQQRTHSSDAVFDGLSRFVLGLTRKLALADPAGVLADSIFALPADHRSLAISWLGLIAYSIQIFHDFAGYSDMAIGMGRMMGLRFPENFNQPYQAQSITDFWRRWHMTLSTWFRDYLYIPLGGNRGGTIGTVLNLGIVFILCGLWHGASWTFVTWGLFHGLILSAEKVAKTKWGVEPSGLIGWLYTYLTICIGWLLFRAESIDDALAYGFNLFGSADNSIPSSVKHLLTLDRVTALALGLLSATIPFTNILQRLNWERSAPWKTFLQGTLMVLGFFYSLMALSANGFNAFIYFRF